MASLYLLYFCCRVFSVSTSRLFFKSLIKLSSLILDRSLLVVCMFSVTFWLIWSVHSMILWSDRKSLLVMSWIVPGLLLMSQSSVFPSLCLCIFMCWCKSYMSKFFAWWWCLDALVCSREYWSPIGWWHSWNFWVEMKYGLEILQERFALLLVALKSKVPCRLWREGMIW